MAIDVVVAVLGVVLVDEDGSARPEAAVGDGFDELAEGLIVVGDVGARGGRAGVGALGVVLGEVDDDEARPGSMGRGLHGWTALPVLPGAGLSGIRGSDVGRLASEAVAGKVDREL